MLCKRDRKILKGFYETKYDSVKEINAMMGAFRFLSESENKERAAFSKEALRIFQAKKQERKAGGAK